MNNQNFNEARAGAFAEVLLDTLNKSSLSFMLSIGHRSGLFDAMSEMDFTKSEEIAANTNLNERYVREWLGAMVTGGIIEYTAESKTYRLPPEHAAFLTRKAGADNIGVFMQYSAVMARLKMRF